MGGVDPLSDMVWELVKDRIIILKNTFSPFSETRLHLFVLVF